MVTNNYLIISHPRSGSNYLFDVLSQKIPNSNFNEPFSDNSNLNHKEVIYTGQLIKTHLNDLLEIQDKKLLNKLLITRYKILLLRKNVFETVLSNQIAQYFRQWDSYTYSTNEKISIDKDEFVNDVDYYINYWKRFNNFKNEYSVNKILYYENLSFNPRKDLKLFTDDKKYLIPVKYEKKAPDKKLIIENYTKLQTLYFSKIENIQIEGIKIKNGLFSFG